MTQSWKFSVLLLTLWTHWITDEQQLFIFNSSECTEISFACRGQKSYLQWCVVVISIVVYPLQSSMHLDTEPLTETHHFQSRNFLLTGCILLNRVSVKIWLQQYAKHLILLTCVIIKWWWWWDDDDDDDDDEGMLLIVKRRALIFILDKWYRCIWCSLQPLRWPSQYRTSALYDCWQ